MLRDDVGSQVVAGVSAAAAAAGWRAELGWHCRFVVGAPRMALLFTLWPQEPLEKRPQSGRETLDDRAPELEPEPREESAEAQPAVAQWRCGARWDVARTKCPLPTAAKWRCAAPLHRPSIARFLFREHPSSAFFMRSIALAISTAN